MKLNQNIKKSWKTATKNGTPFYLWFHSLLANALKFRKRKHEFFFCLVHPGRCNEAYGQWELLNTTETLNVKRSKDVSYKFTTPVSVPSLIITTEVLFSSIGMPISCIHLFEKWTGFDFVCPILICVGDISCNDHRLLHHVYYT